MEYGLGVLKFPPAHFWELTLEEFLAAVDGHMESIGQRKKATVLDPEEFRNLERELMEQGLI